MPQSNSILITDRLLSSWLRCKRKAWLDLFESKEKKKWSAHRSVQLDHQYKSLIAFCTEKPSYGLKAFKKGMQNVVGMRLKGSFAENEKLEGHPLLLQKVEGKSNLGNFQYRPVIAKQGKNLTQAHKLSLAIWGVLLEDFQQSPVKEGIVISLQSQRLEQRKLILTSNLRGQLSDSLKRLRKDLLNGRMPPLTSNRKKCSICSWKEYCDKKASLEGDLSEVSGIGMKRKEMLQSIGIKNIHTLAKTNIDKLDKKLESLNANHGISSNQIINQARVQLRDLPYKTRESKVINELDKAKGLLIYDIESDPDIHHDFLHGLITVRRSDDGNFKESNSNYISIICQDKEEEKPTWLKIKDTLNLYKDWPIIHYGETEMLSICKSAKVHGESPESIINFKNRLIDVHQIIKDNWILPINSYSLKTVAKWLGFQWSQGNVNGAQALFWWRQYKGLNKQKRIRISSINKILSYNRDDCLATLEIIKWLLLNNK